MLLTPVHLLLLQTFEHSRQAGTSSPPGCLSFDLTRTGRLGLFGLVYYGPLQHVWYGLLNTKFPTPPGLPLAARLPGYAAKVVANQLVLGPVVVSSVFVSYELSFCVNVASNAIDIV